MIQILENVFAVEVPKDAKDIEIFRIYIRWINPDDTGGLVFVGFDFEILGTVTPTEIDFDVEPYVWNENEVGITGFKEINDKRFRSALTAAGITQYDKLVILKKL